MSKKSSTECFHISSLSDCNLSEESGNISLPEKSRNYTQLMIFLELYFQPLYYGSADGEWSLVMNFFFYRECLDLERKREKIPLVDQLPIIYTGGGGRWGERENGKYFTFSRLKLSHRDRALSFIMILSDPTISLSLSLSL